MIFDKLTDEDILKSLEAEVAKSISELKCLRKDGEQIDARLRFVLSAIHYLKNQVDDYK